MASANTTEPLYKYINMDVIMLVAFKTFLHPVLPWFLPLAFRALSFDYHHSPLYLSALYAATVTGFFILSHINQLLAYGPPRPAPINSVVITGGSSGLGLMIAQIFSMRGTPVAILDLQPPPDPIPNTTFYECDVGSPESIAKAKASFEKLLNGESVSVLINNAAMLCPKNVLQLTSTDVQRAFSTNVLGHYNMIREFVPDMVDRGNGCLVTVSSVQGMLPVAGCGAYSPTKAAVTSLHHVLSAELRLQKSAVRTLLVAQGQMSTPMFSGIESPNRFFLPVLEPVDLAKEIVKAIDEGRCGEIAMPWYASWVPLYWMMPVSLQLAARKIGVDTAMESLDRKDS